uniref:Secretory leukocyte peptidase inhibitor n=1 Tax=Chelonoidis abingdonii TaxID=106734 RepID=A0A8C0J5P2_CHEAB
LSSSTMQSVGVLLLVGLLTLWTELLAVSGQKKEKPGTCPPDYIRCIRAEPNECTMDDECRGNLKCCHFACAMRCVRPVRSTRYKTPGTCPAITVVCPMVDPPNHCEKDSKCPENKKCCDTGCGKDCVWPQKGPHLF